MVSEEIELAITSIFMIAVSVTAVCGNALVIFAVLWNRRLRTVPNVLFVNLAVADLMQGALAIPLRLAETLSQSDRRPLVPCLAVIPLTVFFFGASNLNLTLISIDRYFCLTRPFLYRSFVTPIKVALVIGVTWATMLVIALLPLLGLGTSGEANTTDICLFYTTLSRGYLLALISVIVIFVDIVLVFTNFFTLKIARKHVRQINAIHGQSWAIRVEIPTANDDQPNEPRQVPNRRQEDTRAAIVVLITVGAFIVLTTPITVIDMLGLLGCHDCSPLTLTKIAVGMAYSNACINVFIYAGLNTGMRRTWVDAFGKIRLAATRHAVDTQNDVN